MNSALWFNPCPSLLTNLVKCMAPSVVACNRGLEGRSHIGCHICMYSTVYDTFTVYGCFLFKMIHIWVQGEGQQYKLDCLDRSLSNFMVCHTQNLRHHKILTNGSPYMYSTDLGTALDPYVGGLGEETWSHDHTARNRATDGPLYRTDQLSGVPKSDNLFCHESSSDSWKL